MTTLEEPAGQRDAVADLAVATRRLMLAVATTDLAAEDIDSARELVDSLSERLSARTRPRMLRPGYNGPILAREAGPEHPWRIFAYNPQALPLSISFDGACASATTTPNALYEGPPGAVHGGYLAHLLDCMLGTLVQAQDKRALTSTLELRYLRPTPMDVPVDLRARIVETTGRRTVAEGRVEHAGLHTVAARGVFVEAGPA